ncbi:hypothetical protein DdX_20867 [Ditylenchus destructor]|uniref:Uncharacterized protein n=1 Tax=Ditylenchus destructor TaxID=166010 RepID=A0AAD4QW08_9BILA|nr:hypothetical protein DdX_20867 [Ditylenchus destructor]
MYDKWLSDNSRSSNADISIKAFITYCRSSDPALFVNLSSNANIECDALIDAFENGTILDETAAINDTGACSAVTVTDTGEKKKRGFYAARNSSDFRCRLRLFISLYLTSNYYLSPPAQTVYIFIAVSCSPPLLRIKNEELC